MQNSECGMQKFLFRGKKKSNGEWVEGYYTAIGGIANILVVAYDEKCDTPTHEYFKIQEVVPETVCLATFSTDKNGKRIFRGDILESRYDEKYPEDFCYEQVLWDNNGFYMKEVGCSDLEPLDVSGCATYSKVVGNIYDNPELLEERDDE